MSPIINVLINELTDKFGDRHFFTLDDIVSIGIFGTHYSARKALKSGQLSYIRVSPRRLIVPRQSLIAYIKEKLT